MNEVARLLTVGHSNKTIEHFLGLLRIHKVSSICDIRITPESTLFPHFGSRVLPIHLQKSGIAYRMSGEALGGHPKERRLYRDDGRVDFRALENERSFRDALSELITLAETPGTALMCKEGDPLACPRFFLIGRILTERGLNVGHILQDGRLQSQSECEAIMLETTGLAAPDLFSSDHERLRDAYDRLMENYEHTWKDRPGAVEID
jgi:uncharacterized protein (DUF488 family)